MINFLDTNNTAKHCLSFTKYHYHERVTEKNGDIYLGGKKTISSDEWFIITNIRIDFQMDAAEFYGLLYTILSEETFNIKRIHI